MAAKFFHCNVCGNVMAAVIPSGVVPYCCESEMRELMPQDPEGTSEQHVPEVTLEPGNKVKIKIGKDYHPCTYEHHICFIVVETDRSVTMRHMEAIELPEIVIQCDGRPTAVYAYCNRHGLWRKLLE